jgi:hypothetical protein
LRLRKGKVDQPAIQPFHSGRDRRIKPGTAIIDAANHIGAAQQSKKAMLEGMATGARLIVPRKKKYKKYLVPFIV